MGAHLATFVYAVGILGLFALDRDRKSKTSIALWIPVVWVSLAASRMVAQWLDATGLSELTLSIDPSAQLLEGNPLDRFLLTLLWALGVIALVGRGSRVGKFLRANTPIIVFFLYCALSILWSDYPDVAFKRWIKALGDLTMVLIVLTDKDPFAAVKRFLSRVGFLLVPISILLIKYYPAMGRVYNRHFGLSYNVGVATGKNELGIICLLFGVGSVWRIFLALQNSEESHRTRSLIAHGAFLAMVLWLFWMANSMTALSCFLMASGLIAVTNFQALARKPWLQVMTVAMLLVSFSALFLGVGTSLVESMGRDPTLTGRTAIWDLVVRMSGNPLFGTGFESFWLGPRLSRVWSVYWWHPNEAHNGYIEVYLDLGLVGVALLATLILTGYRNVVRAMRTDPSEGRLKLAYFVIAVAYNFTESAVRILHPVWIFFLLATAAVPATEEVPESLSPLDVEQTKENNEQFTEHAALVGALSVGLRRKHT